MSSYSSFYLPSNTTYTTYSSTNGSQPKVSTQTFSSDPFAKPSTPGLNYNLYNFSYSSPTALKNPSTTVNTTTNGGYSSPFAKPGSADPYKSPSTATTYGPSNTNYGGYGTNSNTGSPYNYSTNFATNYSLYGNNYGIGNFTSGTTPYSIPFGSSTTTPYSVPSTQTQQPSVQTQQYSFGGSTSTPYTIPSTQVQQPSAQTQQYSFGGSASAPYSIPSTQVQKPSYVTPSISGPSQISIVGISDLSKPGQSFSNSLALNPTDSNFTQLLSKLKAAGQKYKDLDFPPELRSLTGGLSDYELAETGNPLNWRGLVWRRADEIYGKNNFQVFQGSIEPNDVSQGALGDCYFLSTLASLAEHPERIRKIFLTDVPNEQGCYGIRVCDTGIWQNIILDDYFPCSGKSLKPIFTTGNGNEIWVQLLEKAWSKIYGSYARIEAGLTRECLHDLTGAPTKYFLTGDASKHEEIWRSIVAGEKRNYAMTCGAGDFMEGADIMGEAGLVGSHAYSLLAALEINDKYGRKVRLVQLRNPWGKGEWTGDWSDSSSQWTPELRRQLNVQEADDGIFYMTFEDMLKYFTDIQICKIHDDFKYNAVKVNGNPRHATYFKITVKVHGHYYFTVNQESKRKHPEKEDYNYSEVYLVLGKKTANGYEYIEGNQRADKEVWTDGHLTPGEYIVYAKIAWNDGRNKDFALSSYGQGDVEIQQINKSYCSNFLEQVYIQKGRQSQKFEDYQHCGVSNCRRAIELTDDGFGYIYYKNDSNKTLEEEITFNALEGLKLRKPYRGKGFKITVPPGQERIVITKVIPNAQRIRQAFSERARFF